MTRNEARERTEIKSEDLYRVVYLDGKPHRRFHIISDDYAHTNACEYRETLVDRIVKGEL